MQRPIKFRAWDSKNKKIVTSGLSINIDTTERVIPVSFSQGDIAYCRDNNVEIIPNVDEEIDIMQFTGLKDKNGVEIYEGDIVMGLGVVRWYDKDAKYMLHFNDGKHPTVEILAATYSEVIGNIYENPELLDAKAN